MTVRIDHYRMHLEGIRFRARHGASRAERDLPQDFVVGVELELPIASLSRNDSLRGTYDYGKLAALVVDEGTRASHRLLETLAQRLIARIFEESPASRVLLRVKKFGPPTPVSVDTAAIELSAHRGSELRSSERGSERGSP
jgi:dihydroneopterin aldolase